MSHLTSSLDIAAQISSSRAAQRKAKLLQIEKEQKQEDAEALKLTEEQRDTLLQSFSSVKFEFSDLDGMKWSNSALRTRAVPRLDSTSDVIPQFLNLQGHGPRRARAQSLFYPSSPSMTSPSPHSSYFPVHDTPLPKASRGSEALAVLNNMELSITYDFEKTVRAAVSPIKSNFDTVKPPVSVRDRDSRPPTKQQRRRSDASRQRRSRSPARVLFDSERSTLKPQRTLEAGAEGSSPSYSDGAPIERQSTNPKRSLTRTYSQAEITFGVSPTVATEVSRAQKSLGVPEVTETENCWMIFTEDEILESDLVGTIRFSPPVRRGGESKFQAFANPWSVVTPKRATVNALIEEEEEEADGQATLMTPTPDRFCGAGDYLVDIKTPVPQSRTRCDSSVLKRKRQANESQTEAIDEQ
ncbi:hypothetical protein D9757_006082 [Collybiopsis confluens]|uniref:Uncharacterized protein n=1 Tax=Collybiopsis confluens TaxID=2823264 RepID=A0A8H5HHW8_9AGAR|nr:hypothetical protein D9757_006082 [Collybiopsis confluens]